MNNTKVGVEMSSMVANVASFPRVQIKRGDKTEKLFLHPKTKRDKRSADKNSQKQSINQSIDLFSPSTIRKNARSARRDDRERDREKRGDKIERLEAYLPFLSVFLLRFVCVGKVLF